MFSNTFKAFIVVSLLSSCAFAQSITFCVPNGWEKNVLLSENGKKIVFTPQNSPTGNQEALTVVVKKEAVSADKLLWNNLIEIKKEYPDFKYYKPVFEPENSMGLGCTSQGGFCMIQRVEYYEKELYLYTYINNRPHYSQGLFGKWTNILAQISAGEQPLKSKNDEVFEL